MDDEEFYCDDCDDCDDGPFESERDLTCGR